MLCGLWGFLNRHLTGREKWREATRDLFSSFWWWPLQAVGQVMNIIFIQLPHAVNLNVLAFSLNTSCFDFTLLHNFRVLGSPLPTFPLILKAHQIHKQQHSNSKEDFHTFVSIVMSSIKNHCFPISNKALIISDIQNRHGKCIRWFKYIFIVRYFTSFNQ